MELYQEDAYLFHVINLVYGKTMKIFIYINYKVLINGNDLIINYERYKGTHGIWRLLTNPNKKKMIIDKYE